MGYVAGTIGTAVVIQNPTITQGSDATNDVYYRDANGKLARLGIGADGTVLTSTGPSTVPAWETVAAGSTITYSGSAPLYACRAWVNFNGTGTLAIRESENISSVGEDAQGQYTVNIDTDMEDVNYVVSVTSGGSSVSSSRPEDRVPTAGPTLTAGSFIINTYNFAGAYHDAAWVFVAVFR